MGLILRSSSLANPGDSVTVKGSTLDWVEGDGNFVYLLNKINSTIPRLNKLLPKSRQCTKGGITQCPNCAEEGGNWCSWHEGHQAYSPYYCATCGISHHEFI